MKMEERYYRGPCNVEEGLLIYIPLVGKYFDIVGRRPRGPHLHS